MKDTKQKHHQQQDPTSTSQQVAFYSLSCTYFPLSSFEALWNFNVTLSVANGKCRILHNDLDIPYMYVYTHRTWTTLEKVCIITSSAFFNHYKYTLKIVLKESFCLINIRELDKLVNSLDFDINFEFLMCTTYTVSLSLTRSDNTSLSRPSEFLALLSAPFWQVSTHHILKIAKLRACQLLALPFAQQQ